MPYSLFQGGRRRRRRTGRGIAALLAMLAGFLAVVLLAGNDGRQPRGRAATPTPTPAPPLPLEDSATAPLAGGGTAPSPLAVRLDAPRDAVAIHFGRPP